MSAEKELAELRETLTNLAAGHSGAMYGIPPATIGRLGRDHDQKVEDFVVELRNVCKDHGFVLWINGDKPPEIREWIQQDDDYMAAAVFKEN